ncbi:unnamed protein product [Discula destructiva]
MNSEKNPIQLRQRRRLRNSLILLGTALIAYYLFFNARSSTIEHRHGVTSTVHAGPHPPAILNDLSLTTAQCTAYFPHLTDPIDSILSQGHFTIHPASSPVLLSIHNSQLSLLKSQPKRDLSTDMLASRTAALHQLHRALLTTPASDPPLPNTLIALNFQDQPFGTALAYSTQADPESRPGFADGDPDARTWLMPHFSFWAWKLPFVGSMARAAAAVDALERATPFAAKIPKAVWRGTTWFSSVHNPRLRANLVAAAQGKAWADVEPLAWDTVSASADKKGAGGGKDQDHERTASNALPIEEFCRYKYVLHTEGVTYSGRFQFLQMCGSVLLTPPLGWLQHATHLVRPVFSFDLLLSSTGSSEEAHTAEGKAWEASAMTTRAWPRSWGVDEANAVFVKPDWSDLEAVVRWLEAHPRQAGGIARRQREIFVGGGYFSPAAETCYWRALVRAWSEVARWDVKEVKELGEGQTFEAFVLTNGD